MSVRQKRSHKRVSALIFAGAASLSLWMGAAFVQASTSPPALAPQAASTQMVSN